MKIKFKGIAIALMMAVSMGVLLAGSGVFTGSLARAAGPEKDPAIDNGTGKIERASLVRTEHGLSMTIKVSGIDKGHAVTVWWLIDKNDDGEIGDGDGVCNAAGHIVGNSGKFNAGGHLARNEPSEEVCGTFINAEEGTINADEAPLEDTEVMVILEVLDHGEKETGQDLVDSLNDFVTGSDCCTFVGAAIFPDLNP